MLSCSMPGSERTWEKPVLLRIPLGTAVRLDTSTATAAIARTRCAKKAEILVSTGVSTQARNPNTGWMPPNGSSTVANQLLHQSTRLALTIGETCFAIPMLNSTHNETTIRPTQTTTIRLTYQSTLVLPGSLILELMNFGIGYSIPILKLLTLPPTYQLPPITTGLMTMDSTTLILGLMTTN